MSKDEKPEEAKVVSEDEIKKVEEEVLAQRKAEEEAREAEMKALLEKAKQEGSEEAMKHYREEQERRRIAEENQRLREEMAASQKAAEERFAALAKQIEDMKTHSTKKGVAENKSPFESDTPTNDIPRDRETLKQIEEDSRRAFARRYGLNHLM